MSKSEKKEIIKEWYRKYPLRMEMEGDIPLFSSESNRINRNNNSILSPITNLILNVLSYAKKNSNFIICYPSINLKPLPLIAYIIAKKSGKSVLVFSRNKNHHKIYHLLKTNYHFIWYDIPVGIIKKDDIFIEPYVPFARKSFKEELKLKIPEFKNKFFNKYQSKILFYLNKDIKLKDSIKKL
ncbi:unnamed protein product, partial [marine sediment metagenome]